MTEQDLKYILGYSEDKRTIQRSVTKKKLANYATGTRIFESINTCSTTIYSNEKYNYFEIVENKKDSYKEIKEKLKLIQYSDSKVNRDKIVKISEKNILLIKDLYDIWNERDRIGLFIDSRWSKSDIKQSKWERNARKMLKKLAYLLVFWLFQNWKDNTNFLKVIKRLWHTLHISKKRFLLIYEKIKEFQNSIKNKQTKDNIVSNINNQSLCEEVKGVEDIKIFENENSIPVDIKPSIKDSKNIANFNQSLMELNIHKKEDTDDEDLKSMLIKFKSVLKCKVKEWNKDNNC